MDKSTSKFDVGEALGLFRDALVSLVPIAERARIEWKGGAAYDPWEDIERAVFKAMVTSIVENAVPVMFKPLPKYGLSYTDYVDLSFVSNQNSRLRGELWAFVYLDTEVTPFDEACFLKLDLNFTPMTELIRVPLTEITFELAARTDSGLSFIDRASYLD